MGPAREHDGDDRRLLDAACGGDERAYGVLLGRHRDGLEILCGLMLGDAAQAVRAMDEVVLIGWRARASAPRLCSVRIWLYRIALGVCSELSGCDEFRCRRTLDRLHHDEKPGQEL